MMKQTMKEKRPSLLFSKVYKYKPLSIVQRSYVSGMSFLLGLQMLLLVGCIYMVQKFIPTRQFLFVKNNAWVDVGISLLMAIIAFSFVFSFTNYRSKVHSFFRLVGFFGIGVLLAYVLGIQYNILRSTSSKEKVRYQLTVAIVLTLLLYIAVVCFLPHILSNPVLLRRFQQASPILFVLLIILIITGFFVHSPHTWYLWLVCGLLLFTVFFITDISLLVSRCTTPKTKECDAVTGGTVLWVDLMNILQKIFLLQSMKK
jgi:hypothetical protein